MFSAILQMIVPASVAQTKVVPDVDSLGDVWAVTIDNSFSMMRKGGKPLNKALVVDSVKSRLLRSPVLRGVDWERDRFVFYKSGLSDISVIRKVSNLDTSFIQHIDRKMHQFANIRAFVSYVGEVMLSLKYGNFQSFVSQMRSLSLKKTIDWLCDSGETKSYRNIYTLAISDDAVDQHDQWSTDYRTLKDADTNKVNYIIKNASRLVYNPLNGMGGGELKLAWHDDSRLPYIWIYNYITSEGKRTTDTSATFLDIEASDGHNISFNLRNNEPKPCLCWIDSVRVNDNTIPIGKYFPDSLIFKTKYDNGYFNNDITVYGKAQIEYTDSILCDHYRVVDFVQKSQSMPRHLAVILNAVALIAVLGIIIFIIMWYSLVVLRIYANGKCLSIKWYAMNRLRHDDYTLLSMVFRADTSSEAFFYKGRGIKEKKDNCTKLDDNLIFVKSLRLLTPEYQDLYVDEISSGKYYKIEYNVENAGQSFSFQFSNRLSHKLLITMLKENGQATNPTNNIQAQNIKMLASYYEQNAESINSIRNNVMVNIIGRETLGLEYKYDYAVLNIYDLNSQNDPRRIFLRFSMVCFFDRKKNETAVKEARIRMHEIASFVLKSEHEVAGYITNNAFTQNKNLDSGIQVDVSPMLSYLYLLKKGKHRMVYSPFKDGDVNLTSKTIKIFPNTNMVLMNLPTKHKYPENKTENPTKIELGKNCHKTENILFLQNDTVKFMDNEKCWEYGTPVPYHNGITYYSYSIDYKFNK